jgi:hypothetical protein
MTTHNQEYAKNNQPITLMELGMVGPGRLRVLKSQNVITVSKSRPYNSSFEDALLRIFGFGDVELSHPTYTPGRHFFGNCIAIMVILFGPYIVGLAVRRIIFTTRF